MTKILTLGLIAACLSGCTISSSAQTGKDKAALDPITQEACNACPKSCAEDKSTQQWCVGWWGDARGGY